MSEIGESEVVCERRGAAGNHHAQPPEGFERAHSRDGA